MNLPAVAPDWAVWLLLALLTAAAVEDCVRLRISNLVPIAILLLAFAVAVLAGPRSSLWENMVVFGATLVVGTFLFGAGKLGGGDVKLLAATGLWFDLGAALWFLVAVAIAGGILAFLLLAVRMFEWSEGTRERVVVLKRRGGIPYGVAIAVGAVFVVSVSSAEQERPDPLRNWTLPAPR